MFLGTNLGQFLVGFQDRISKDTVSIPHVTDTVLSDLNKSKIIMKKKNKTEPLWQYTWCLENISFYQHHLWAAS